MTQLTKFMDEMEPFDILFRNFFDADAFYMPIKESSFKYPVDIYEENNMLQFEIAVTGINKEDINIEEDNNILRVIYNKNEESDNESKNYIKRSIAKRSFNFGWKISDKFDLTKIEASMENGILKISIPKSEKEAIKKTISIK
ncbi:Hsp20/alpha crystallin family protein [bacterium]|jgi:HSP20 family protein|nr:Hsp20/alpha crystallin family protein [bacterium]